MSKDEKDQPNKLCRNIKGVTMNDKLNMALDVQMFLYS